MRLCENNIEREIVMPRFFLEELDESDVCITGPDARHIGLALRMRVGEMLTVCAYGRDYQCRIRSITPEEVHLDVVSSELCAAEPSVSLTLYQAVPKADKLEQIIQKSVELGVTRIVPVLTRRCISRPKPAGVSEEAAAGCKKSRLLRQSRRDGASFRRSLPC